MRGIEGYSHIIVLYWMHEVNGFKLLGRPWKRVDLPLVGVFATRFPHRPNPIGLTVVELRSVEPPRLYVRGLDAWNGSPVIDLKPYDYHDVVKCPQIPNWLEERWAESRVKYSRIAPWMGPCC